MTVETEIELTRSHPEFLDFQARIRRADPVLLRYLREIIGAGTNDEVGLGVLNGAIEELDAVLMNEELN
jgi:hypothetical protein